MDTGKSDSNNVDSVQQLFRRHDAVLSMRMFGSDGLKTKGRVFVMFVDGDLVAKVPFARAEDLVRSGIARRFDPGDGRVLREWVRVGPAGNVGWTALAREAYHYVARTTRGDGRRTTR